MTLGRWRHLSGFNSVRLPAAPIFTYLLENYKICEKNRESLLLHLPTLKSLESWKVFVEELSKIPFWAWREDSSGINV